MKDLGRTIDRILKVDPALGEFLIPIKNKWRKFPARTMNYWKELTDVLNSDGLMAHPRRTEIKSILVTTRRPVKKLSSFDQVTPNEKVVGIIPENLADRIRRHDRITIELSKKRVEASMTKNSELAAEVSKKEMAMELAMKRTWYDLKTMFKLWNKPSSYGIRRKDPLLVLVEMVPVAPRLQVMPGSTPSNGAIKLDREMMRKFFEFMGMEPPPDMFPEDDPHG